MLPRCVRKELLEHTLAYALTFSFLDIPSRFSRYKLSHNIALLVFQLRAFSLASKLLLPLHWTPRWVF